MSSEGFLVSNPKNNNRDLEIWVDKRDGSRKKIKTLRPGEAFHSEKSEIIIQEVRRPLRLVLHADGSFEKDRGR